MEILRFVSTSRKHWRLYESSEFWQYLVSIYGLRGAKDPKTIYRQWSMNKLIKEICDRDCHGIVWTGASIYSNIMLLRTFGEHETICCVVNLFNSKIKPFRTFHGRSDILRSQDRLVILEDEHLYQFDCRTGKFISSAYCKTNGLDSRNCEAFSKLFPSVSPTPPRHTPQREGLSGPLFSPLAKKVGVVVNNLLYAIDDEWQLLVDLEHSFVSIVPV